MTTAKTMMSLLLLSAVCVSPASANWFSNPRAGTNLNVGSAPNPTPADLRAIGDSTYASAPSQVNVAVTDTYTYIQPRHVAYTFTQTTPAHAIHMAKGTDLANMEGRMLYGSHGERLGSILTVDRGKRMVDVQTPGGVAVAMRASLITQKGNRLVAMHTSRADMTAMAKSQTGHTVAMNIDMRHRASRG
jgi:hypothetical protein